MKWTIISVLVSIPSQSGTLTYNGSAQTPKWQNFDNENSSVNVSAKTNAGDYTATFTLKKGMWTDGTTAAKTLKVDHRQSYHRGGPRPERHADL